MRKKKNFNYISGFTLIAVLSTQFPLIAMENDTGEFIEKNHISISPVHALSNDDSLSSNSSIVKEEIKENKDIIVKNLLEKADDLYDLAKKETNSINRETLYKEAFAKYTEASHYNNTHAQNRIGFIYAKGLGVSENQVIAVEWYKKAAEGGNSKAQYNLGRHYRRGIGTPEDKSAALKWFREAEKQGDKEASLAIREMEDEETLITNLKTSGYSATYLGSTHDFPQIFQGRGFFNTIHLECPDCTKKREEHWRKTHKLVAGYLVGPLFYDNGPSKCFKCGAKEFFKEDIPNFFKESVPNLLSEIPSKVPFLRGILDIHHAKTFDDEIYGARKIADDFIDYSPKIINGVAEGVKFGLENFANTPVGHNPIFIGVKLGALLVVEGINLYLIYKTTS